MASKRNHRRHACTGKRRYPTLDDAVRSIRDYPDLRAYRCSLCGGGWHLGHAPAGPKNRAVGLLK